MWVSRSSPIHFQEPASPESASASGICVLKRISARRTVAMAPAAKKAHSRTRIFGDGFRLHSKQASAVIAEKNAAKKTSALVRKISPSRIPLAAIQAVTWRDDDARQKQA